MCQLAPYIQYYDYQVLPDDVSTVSKQKDDSSDTNSLY